MCSLTKENVSKNNKSVEIRKAFLGRTLLIPRTGRDHVTLGDLVLIVVEGKKGDENESRRPRRSFYLLNNTVKIKYLCREKIR